MKSFYEWVKLLENQRKIHASYVLQLSDRIEDLRDNLAETEAEIDGVESKIDGYYPSDVSLDELMSSKNSQQQKIQVELDKWKRMFGEDYPGTGDFEVVDDGMSPYGIWSDVQMLIKRGPPSWRINKAIRPYQQKPEPDSDNSRPDFDPNML